MNATIAARVAALHHVLVVAADTDPEAATLLSTLEQQRADGARNLVARLHELGGLRPELDRDRASAIVDLLMDPLPYRRLVQLRRWSMEEYTEYLEQAAVTALFPPKVGGPKRQRARPAVTDRTS